MSQAQKPELKPIADPEVSDRPCRRTFTAEYKLKILREIEACEGAGQVGAILRREGLYHSHLSKWRLARDGGQMMGLTPKKRGRPVKQANPLSEVVDRLEREKTRVQEELRKARIIIEVQKNSR